MERWSACPGSVRLSEGIASTSSVYAEEGTKAHELASLLLLGEKVDIPDEEMADAIDVYVTDMLNRAKGNKLHVEHRFDLSKVHPGCFGTADCVIWDAKRRHLIVADFKYGAGIPVEVKDNKQLRFYGLGALVDLGYPARTVELVVIQPRCYHPEGPVRSETIDAIDMLDFKVDLIQFAKATEDPNAALKSGEHCKFCPAAGVCPLLHEQALAAAKTVFSPAASYDPAKLADALRLAPVLKAWASSVTEFAYAEAEQGRCPPGYKLVAKRANRKWRDEPAAIQALTKAGLGEPELYGEPSLKSPAAIEKHLGKKEFVAVAGDLVVSESSGHTLAPLDDKRPPVKPTAQDAFKPIEN